MRTHLLSVFVIVVGLGVTGCGGNWSNTDLVFANALPRSEDLRARLPAGTSTQPLTGVSTRRDGLMVGDPSNAWALTRQATRDFNGIVDALLGIIDQVRKVAPTSRTSTTRTWGPFPDSNNPGREIQVVIERIDEINFAWRVESRPKGGDFIRVITGNFVANTTGTARLGQGTIEVPVKDFRDVVKVDGKIATLDSITIAYLTDLWPRRVEMFFVAAPGQANGLSSLGYTSLLNEDTSGSMRFEYTTTNPATEEYEITASWKPNGAGRAEAVVNKGTYVGAHVSECWNSSQLVTWYTESWMGGVTSGNASDCP